MTYHTVRMLPQEQTINQQSTSPELFYSPCNLCGGSAYHVVYASTLTELPGPESVKITDGNYQICGQIVRCATCGLVYVNPRPDDKTIVSLYSSMEDPAYQAEAGGRKIAFRRILRRLSRIRQADPERISLLDVGAATGLLLQEAGKRGWQCAGVEPSQWAAKVAREIHGLRVHDGTLRDCPFERKSFTFITAIDVLEHVSDPRGLLTEFHNWLQPGGVVCVVTPDFDSLVARTLKAKWWHVRQAHLYYFNTETFRRMIEETGYKVVLRKRYGWTFSVDYWASRFENFSRPIYWLSQTLKRRKLFEPVFRWNIRFNFRDSFEWYLKEK